MRKLVQKSFAALFALTVSAAANAQVYSTQPPPLYPYATGSIGASARVYPYVGSANDPAPRMRPVKRGEPRAAKPELELTDVQKDRIERRKKVGPTNHALVEELKRRAAKGRHTVSYVYEKPRVIERRHIVDVPVVIERRRIVDDPPQDVPPQTSRQIVEEDMPPVARPHRKRASSGETRVIRAEAEIRITGDDQMSIRLFRKGSARASAVPAD